MKLHHKLALIVFCTILLLASVWGLFYAAAIRAEAQAGPHPDSWAAIEYICEVDEPGWRGGRYVYRLDWSTYVGPQGPNEHAVWATLVDVSDPGRPIRGSVYSAFLWGNVLQWTNNDNVGAYLVWTSDDDDKTYSIEMDRAYPDSAATCHREMGIGGIMTWVIVDHNTTAALDVPETVSAGTTDCAVMQFQPQYAGAPLTIQWRRPDGGTGLIQETIVGDNGSVSLVIGAGSFPAASGDVYTTNTGEQVYPHTFYDFVIDGQTAMTVLHAAGEGNPACYYLDGIPEMLLPREGLTWETQRSVR